MIQVKDSEDCVQVQETERGAEIVEYILSKERMLEQSSKEEIEEAR